MKLLLDTHTLLWLSLDDPQLSDTARELIADLDNELLLRSCQTINYRNWHCVI
jgi:PIN domain nuclease of toxin-antitoxin system